MQSYRKATTQAFFTALVTDLFIITLYGLACYGTQHRPSPPEAMLVACLLLVHWVQWLALAWVSVAADQEASILAVKPPETSEAMVDPWQLQQALMRASGQPLPAFPILNNTGILYSALSLEELGETLTGITKVLGRFTPKHSEDFDVRTIDVILSNLARELTYASVQVRSLLANVTVNQPLHEHEAVELLDGTTDVAVVTAGFALACGLPGAKGYLEVICSNLSKANPATGLIDKDAGGKWIKGSDFFKPNLSKILASHFVDDHA
jgi:hypothetical protein